MSQPWDISIETSPDGPVRIAGKATGSPGGGSQPGELLPTAVPVGATVDDTTYDNTLSGSGKLTTLVFPTAADYVAFALAVEGDAFPRVLIGTDPAGYFAFLYGDGTQDASGAGAAFALVPQGSDTAGATIQAGTSAFVVGVIDQTNVPQYNRVINPLQIGLGGAIVSSGTGAPTAGGNVGDMYIRKDGGDGSWLYRCTTAGVAGVAVWAAKL